MLPQYTASDLKDIKVESDLFQNERLSEYVVVFIAADPKTLVVVVSDPKSKTGEQDKKKLQQMSVALSSNYESSLIP